MEGNVKGLIAQPDDEVRILSRIARLMVQGYDIRVGGRPAGRSALGKVVGSIRRVNGIEGETSEEAEREDAALEGGAASDFRATVAWANFVAIDRPGMAYAVKVLCRSMSGPTQRDAEAMELLMRCLLERPGLVRHFC